MKYYNFLIIIICIVLLSCFNNNNNNGLIKQLNNIKLQGDTCPTIAIERLDSLSNIIDIDKESKYIKNKYALLKIRLHDKAYITHTTESVIKEVCHYFEKHGTAKEIQEAYYYMGSVYRDMNDSPNAVTYFLKATNIGEEKKNIDTTLLVNSYSQLSGIYIKQFNDSAALNAATTALNIAKKIKDTDVRLYMNVASCYFAINDTTNFLRYSKSALEKIIKDKKEKENADIIAKQMCDYAKLGYKEEAYHCYYLLKQLSKKDLPNNYLINLAIYYDKCVHEDSAANIYKKLYKSTDRITQIYNSSQQLTKYYSKKEDYKNATFYALKFIEANEAVIKQRQLEQTTNANNIFKYNEKKEEYNKIKQNAEKHRLYFIIGISVSIIVTLVIILLFYHRKNKLLNIIISKEEEINNIQELIVERDNLILTEKQILNQKEKELKDKTDKNKELIVLLQKAENTFKELIAQNKELTRRTFMNSADHNAEDIIEKCKKSINGKHNLSNEEWKELLSAIDKQYPDFIDEIQNKFKKIDEPMLRICYLLKIGLSNPQIKNLTNYPPQTVWYRVKRIEQVLGYNFHQHKKSL